MASCPTIKVKPWGKGQGDFVEINAEDFDPAVHEHFEGEGGTSPSAPPLETEVAPVKAKPAPRRRKRKAKR